MQAREVTDHTTVTIIEQDTRKVNPMHKSLSSPGRLAIPPNCQQRILEHLRGQPQLGGCVNIA